MKKKELQKLLKKNKSNAGFTLTELLVGLFMSIFVIGALGFGLMQVLRTSQSEGSKTAARNETGRALDFISDELRRAQAIEVNMSDGHIFDNPDAVAPAYKNKLPAGGTVRLALQIPGVDQRVIYSVAPPQSGSPWKGPLVIYRWGPELTANGSYVTDPTKAGRVNNPAGWTNEALIDKVNDTEQTETCGGTSTIFSGFFACVLDDDGDTILDAAGNPIVENATDTNGDGVINSDDPGVTDKNGDGKINNEDGADIDGQAITAQLYFTGETITVTGASGYSADTQTVARARIAPDNNSEDLNSYTWSFQDIGGNYGCKINSPDWQMRTNFGTNTSDLNADTTPWDRDPNKQSQPLEIDPNQPLVITSIPFGMEVCDSIGNNLDDLNDLDDLDLNDSNTVKVSHTIDFGNPITFNGDQNGGVYNTTQVDSNKPAVQFLKKGSEIPFPDAYDADNDGVITIGGSSQDQPSLGRFLFERGLAIPKTSGDDPYNKDTVFVIPTTSSELQSFLSSSTLPQSAKDKFKLLGEDQRIIAFEVGQKDPLKDNDGNLLANPDNKSKTNPGFDLQDNIFIVTSDVFKKKFDSNCFGGSGCS